MHGPAPESHLFLAAPSAYNARMNYQDIREAAYEANMKIPEYKLAPLTWGNASQADAAKGVFAIKPSGVPYPDLSPAKMVIVDFDGNQVEGDYRPSSDTPTHAVLFKAWPTLGGIVHTHSAHAVGWAQACRSVPVLGTTHADYATMPIPCTAYLSPDAVKGDYETETGRIIVDTLGALGIAPADLKMILVAGHGPFTWGSSAMDAVNNSLVLEEICRMAMYTFSINPAQGTLPAHIIEKHWFRKHGAGAYYGQSGR